MNIRERFSDEQIGLALQMIRKEHGFTQQAVATYLEVARTTMVAIEKGERAITVTEVLLILELYQLPIDSLIAFIQSIVLNTHYRPKVLNTPMANQDYADWILSQREFLEIAGKL